MLTESQVKLARYSTVEKEPDKLGRAIGVRRLKPSEQTKVAAMTSDVAGSDELINDKGEKVYVPHRMPLLIAAAVCLIIDENGEQRISFPRTRGELDAIYDRLDQEGIEAAGTALVRLSATVDIGNPADDAKN